MLTPATFASVVVCSCHYLKRQKMNRLDTARSCSRAARHWLPFLTHFVERKVDKSLAQRGNIQSFVPNSSHCWVSISGFGARLNFLEPWSCLQLSSLFLTCFRPVSYVPLAASPHCFWLAMPCQLSLSIFAPRINRKGAEGLDPTLQKMLQIIQDYKVVGSCTAGV